MLRPEAVNPAAAPLGLADHRVGGPDAVSGQIPDARSKMERGKNPTWQAPRDAVGLPAEGVGLFFVSQMMFTRGA